MKAKLTFGKLSFEWETPENDVGVVLRQILSAYPDREPVPATVSDPKTIVVPESESEEDPEAPIEEEPEPEPEPEELPTIEELTQHREVKDLGEMRQMSPTPIIPPEPKEREPLGKAIERLQKEKKMRGGRNNCKPIVLKKDGEKRWFETVVEAAIFLDVNPTSISNAKKRKHKVKGWSVESDEPKTKL